VEFEVILRGGRVFDGSGAPAREVDLGLGEGRILAIGDLSQVSAPRVLDLQGARVLPGFVDVHTHYDLCLDWKELSDHCLRQGITSVVGGNCGLGDPDVGAVLGHAQEVGLGVHFGVLAPLGPLRSGVVPRAEGRPAGPSERERLAAEVEAALAAGALGVSWGPYHANALMDAAEIEAALKPAARLGRPWCVHRRREGIGGLEATQEALELARAAGVPLQISHLKAAGKLSWDSLEPVLECVDAARSEQDLSVDVYPYDASLTYLSAMIPDALKSDGGLAGVLSDPARRPEAGRGVEAWFERRMGPEAIVILEPSLPGVERGSTLAEAADALGTDAVEAALRLIAAEDHTTGGWAIYREMMDPEQVEAVLDLPYAAVASDAVPEEAGDAISAHPRAFASFTRALARAERIGEARLADAVRQATRLPAERFGLTRRGRIEEGAAADLVVLSALEEGASYRDPCVYPRGVDYVFVAGQVALEQGEPTGVRAGTVLRA
jgi:N-acyl-D-amino-acid deacylase